MLVVAATMDCNTLTDLSGQLQTDAPSTDQNGSAWWNRVNCNYGSNRDLLLVTVILRSLSVCGDTIDEKTRGRYAAVNYDLRLLHHIRLVRRHSAHGKNAKFA